jgi:hypothetical protein
VGERSLQDARNGFDAEAASLKFASRMGGGLAELGDGESANWPFMKGLLKGRIQLQGETMHPTMAVANASLELNCVG